MGDFKARMFTVVFGSLVALLLVTSNPQSYCMFFTLICLGCLYEFNACREETSTKFSMSVALSVYGIAISYSFGLIPGRALSLIFPMLLSLFAFEVVTEEDFCFVRAGLGAISIIWIALPMAMCTHLALYQGGFNPKIIVGLLFIIWWNDGGAYCVGRLSGNTPLHPKLSPRKTWEGAVGGALCSFFAAYTVRNWLVFAGQSRWLQLFMICTICGDVGDLIESMFKRSVSIKDTSSILPGHGGVLDRFDAVIFTMPFIVTYLVMIGEITH